MINKIQKVVNQVLNQYGVQVDAKFGINTTALSLILTTELFKELSGANAPKQTSNNAKKPVKPQSNGGREDVEE